MMFEWLKFWFKGYQATFDSPYPIEQCAQILRDHSQPDYFEANKHWALRLGKKIRNDAVFVDVHQVSNDYYQFIIKKRLLEGSNVDFWVEFRGTLEHTPANTQVNITLLAGRLNWLWISLIMLISLIIPLYFIAFWLFLGRPLMQFIRYPYQLLGGEPTLSPNQLTPSRWNPLNNEFNFHTNQPIVTCIEKLEHGSHHTHFQLTPLGMMFGKTTPENLFIGFQEASPTKTYFWISNDNIFGQWGLPIQLFGTLQTEDDGTRVMGFSKNRVNLTPVLPYIGVFIVVSIIFPFIGVVAGLVYFANVIHWYNQTVNRTDYPAKKILNKPEISPTRAKLWGWLKLRHTFDFYSPYPLVDCVNMLLNYSTTEAHKTPMGTGKGVKLDNGYWVRLYEENETTHQVWISQDKNIVFTRLNIEIIATLKAEGYGTRVKGYNKDLSAIAWVISNILFVFTFLLIFRIPMFFVITPPLMGIIYINVLSAIYQLRRYPQQALGAKSGRKLAGDADKNVDLPSSPHP